MRIGCRGCFCGVCLFGATVRNGLKIVHTIRFGGRICIMLFVLLRYIIVSCRFSRYQIGNQTHFFQIHVVNDFLRIVLLRLSEIHFCPIIIEPLPIECREAVHEVKDALIILRHIRYRRRILGVGNQVDLSIFLCRFLYYGGKGLVHP